MVLMGTDLKLFEFVSKNSEVWRLILNIHDSVSETENLPPESGFPLHPSFRSTVYIQRVVIIGLCCFTRRRNHIRSCRSDAVCKRFT